MASVRQANVTAVTVTYGRRWHLLRQALCSARAEGVANAIVVNNGSLDTAPEILASEFGAWASWVDLEHNRGSAVGFAAGITAACERGAQRILLLDDDNILAAGSLAILEQALERAEEANTICAVFGLRAGHGKEQFLADAKGRRLRHAGAVFGFHIANLPGKLVNRFTTRHQQAPADAYAGNMIGPVARREGPYGGLLFSADLIARIGIPDARYVLYQDDTEFTRRIARSDGQLLLVPAALIHDAEASWDNAGGKQSAIRGFVDAESDFRVYYTFRNKTHLDHHRSPRSIMIWLNSLVYLSLLAAYALSKRRGARLRMLLVAWQQGRREILGVHPNFPLQ